LATAPEEGVVVGLWLADSELYEMPVFVAEESDDPNVVVEVITDLIGKVVGAPVAAV
jgi:hypothetical protein